MLDKGEAESFPLRAKGGRPQWKRLGNRFFLATEGLRSFTFEAERIPLLPWAVQRGVATTYPCSHRYAAHFVRGIFRHNGFALNRILNPQPTTHNSLNRKSQIQPFVFLKVLGRALWFVDGIVWMGRRIDGSPLCKPIKNRYTMANKQRSIVFK